MTADLGGDPISASRCIMTDISRSLLAPSAMAHPSRKSHTSSEVRQPASPHGGDDQHRRGGHLNPVQSDFVTADEFAALARLSRRQIDRLRKERPTGFPREYELGSGLSKYRSCPRFKRIDVDRWLDSRALW